MIVTLFAVLALVVMFGRILSAPKRGGMHPRRGTAGPAPTKPPPKPSDAANARPPWAR